MAAMPNQPRNIDEAYPARSGSCRRQLNPVEALAVTQLLAGGGSAANDVTEDLVPGLMRLGLIV